MKIKSFECPESKKLWKKILGTSDAWLTSAKESIFVEFCQKKDFYDQKRIKEAALLKVS